MSTIDLMREALGPPMALQQFGNGQNFVAAVGRWRHDGTFVDLRSADTFQVVFNISGGQEVELTSGQGAVHKSIRAGSVGVVLPGVVTSVAVAGPADIVQFVLTRDLIESMTGHRVPGEPSQLALSQPKLQAAAAQALVQLKHARPGHRDALQAIVADMARQFTPTIRPSVLSKGGLAPAARRRVQAVIDASLAADLPSPVLRNLARAAGLSTYHFARSFRQTEGETPGARVAACRIDASLTLLLKAGARVDEVAETMGFSSPSHFVSSFRRHVGVTPGALRDATRAGT